MRSFSFLVSGMYYNFEIFHMKDRGIPVDSVEVGGNLIANPPNYKEFLPGALPLGNKRIRESQARVKKSAKFLNLFDDVIHGWAAPLHNGSHSNNDVTEMMRPVWKTRKMAFFIF